MIYGVVWLALMTAGLAGKSHPRLRLASVALFIALLLALLAAMVPAVHASTTKSNVPRAFATFISSSGR